MLISELEAQLKTLREEHGDLEVLSFYDALCGYATCEALVSTLGANDILCNGRDDTRHVKLQKGDKFIEIY